jgi:hypothetical protein
VSFTFEATSGKFKEKNRQDAKVPRKGGGASSFPGVLAVYSKNTDLEREHGPRRTSAQA